MKKKNILEVWKDFCVGNDHYTEEQMCDSVCVDAYTCASACVSQSFSQSCSSTPGLQPLSPNTIPYLHP